MPNQKDNPKQVIDELKGKIVLLEAKIQRLVAESGDMHVKLMKANNHVEVLKEVILMLKCGISRE